MLAGIVAAVVVALIVLMVVDNQLSDRREKEHERWKAQHEAREERRKREWSDLEELSDDGEDEPEGDADEPTGAELLGIEDAHRAAAMAGPDPVPTEPCAMCGREGVSPEMITVEVFPSDAAFSTERGAAEDPLEDLVVKPERLRVCDHAECVEEAKAAEPPVGDEPDRLLDHNEQGRPHP